MSKKDQMIVAMTGYKCPKCDNWMYATEDPTFVYCITCQNNYERAKIGRFKERF